MLQYISLKQTNFERLSKMSKQINVVIEVFTTQDVGDDVPPFAVIQFDANRVISILNVIDQYKLESVDITDFDVEFPNGQYDDFVHPTLTITHNMMWLSMDIRHVDDVKLQSCVIGLTDMFSDTKLPNNTRTVDGDTVVYYGIEKSAYQPLIDKINAQNL